MCYLSACKAYKEESINNIYEKSKITQQDKWLWTAEEKDIEQDIKDITAINHIES